MDSNAKSSSPMNIPSQDHGNGVSNPVFGEDDFKAVKGAEEQPQPPPPITKCPSPEIVGGFSPSANRPPRIPTTDSLTRRKTFVRSVLSKPKTRFGEQQLPVDSNLMDEIGTTLQENAQENAFSPTVSLSNRASPLNNLMPSRSNSLREAIRSLSLTPKAAGLVGEDEAEIIYKKVDSQRKLKIQRVKKKVLVEWVVFLLITGSLIASLTLHKLKNCVVWGLEIWKWCLLVLVTFSGMLVTKWFINIIVFLIEKNFLFKRKVLYFVHGMKHSVQVFIWLSLILICWISFFKYEVQRSAQTSKFLDFITWTLVTLLIGSVLWMLKTFLLKILASSFHVRTFFDRIQEALFNQYILRTLSGPPVMELARMVGRSNSADSQLNLQRKKKKTEAKVKEVVDMNKLYQMKQEKVSAWTMKVLVDAISKYGLSTISFSNALDENYFDGEGEQADNEITNEMEAIAAAYHIFVNVAKPGSKVIDDEDLRRFMIKEEVEVVFPLMETSDAGQIDKKSLTDWVVKAYQSRKALGHALSDTKTAVKQLNKLLTAILLIIIFIIWINMTEIASTKALVFLSSQILVAAFIFKNMCKTIFEALIFVFVMHPFDVGDRCVIDGIQMTVEEMNILSTVFLRFDNEMIYYPNAVLAMKPISNFYRSPDMGDSMEFSIDFFTPLEKIGAMKEKIKIHLEKNSHHWHPNHNLVVKEIENVNKLKMALFFNHTMNFQLYGEKTRRKTELILEMKKIFEELEIKYHLLPQQVHLLGSAQTSSNVAAT
ncbi:mechanosensitive ion channel protein 10-like [Impatiens glandulifera]|uniref:mechanosensitive ion channel protein 10-like n=1 Tax=Impatiens glandulifera TaxID=253017 RepID=UPI001FB0A324|nr:mechanosensitive ion channel protein 10-like [Impatiens glandulifera]